MLKQGRSALLALAATASVGGGMQRHQHPDLLPGRDRRGGGRRRSHPVERHDARVPAADAEGADGARRGAGRARLRHARPLDLARQGPHRGLVQGRRTSATRTATSRCWSTAPTSTRSTTCKPPPRRSAGTTRSSSRSDDAAAPARCRRERQRHRARGRLRGGRAGPRCARALERRRPGEPDVRGRADQPLGGQPDRPEPRAAEPGRPGHVRGRRAAQDRTSR